MKMTFLRLAFACWLFYLIFTCIAYGGGKVGIYGIRMVPYGTDAESYSRPGWGGGLHAVVPMEELSNIVAGTIGFDIVNLLNEEIAFQDQVTGLIGEQQTDQDYYRFYVGGQVGGHGNGFLRPHAGFDLALVYYHFGVDAVLPNNAFREQEIRSHLKNRGDFAVGYDLALGLDLNFSNTLAFDGGVKYLKNFGVPQQLGAGSVRIHPQYFQIYLGIGYSLDFLNNEGD